MATMVFYRVITFKNGSSVFTDSVAVIVSRITSGSDCDACGAAGSLLAGVRVTKYEPHSQYEFLRKTSWLHIYIMNIKTYCNIGLLSQIIVMLSVKQEAAMVIRVTS